MISIDILVKRFFRFRATVKGDGVFAIRLVSALLQPGLFQSVRTGFCVSRDSDS